MPAEEPTELSLSTKPDTTTVAAEASSETKESRLPKRKVALLMSYCGTGYCGMQMFTLLTSAIPMFLLLNWIYTRH
jgi:hypothetical protein